LAYQRDPNRPLAAEIRHQFRFAEGVGLFFVQPMVRLPNAAREGVIHASPVPHCEADRPAAGCTTKDHQPDPNGFQRPRQ